MFQKRKVLSGVFAAGVSAVALMAAQGAQAETRSFVVSYFYDANYSDGKTDCPDGTNTSSIDFYRRDLLRLYPKEKVEEVLRDFPGEGGLQQPWIPLVMTRGNGKDNVYTNPTSAPDPGLKLVQSKYSYGFDLDGKAGKGSFLDPETKKPGIDNQLYRVMGCIRSFRGLPPPGRPSLAENLWDVLRDVVPAWVITVSGSDLSKDGDVTISFDRALERMTRDATGGTAQADLTYQVDPDPRAHNELKGKIKNGVVTTTEPADVHMKEDPYLLPEYNWTQAKMTFDTRPGVLRRGMIGGYLPWRDLFYAVANQGHIKEYATSIDVPAFYYALERNADADPDPVTKRNRRISTAYMIEAVPAFVVPARGGQTADASR
jgi:hypothetical protein